MALLVNILISNGESMPDDIKVSAPPFNQSRVICPYCDYNNAMGKKHERGMTVNCSSCYREFVIG
jgi:hypothetical protein